MQERPDFAAAIYIYKNTFAGPSYLDWGSAKACPPKPYKWQRVGRGPPYIDPHNHTGFELDLIRRVVEEMGHSTKLVYVPHRTTIDMLNRGNVDMAITLNQQSGVTSDYLSDVYITYQNVAVSLTKNDLQISSVEDLKGHSLIGFQSATRVLGDAFNRVTMDNPLYFEMADQRNQVELLLQGNAELIVVDINVFTYLHQILSAGKAQQKVKIHPVFSPNPFRVGFKDPELKNDFNQALKAFFSSGDYPVLRQQYNIQTVVTDASS